MEKNPVLELQTTSEDTLVRKNDLSSTKSKVKQAVKLRFSRPVYRASVVSTLVVFALIGVAITVVFKIELETVKNQIESLKQQESLSAVTCPKLTAPDKTTVVLSTTATYSCDPGYALAGDTERSCENYSGMWSGGDPICAMLNSGVIDCRYTPCRYQQLVCPERDNCTVHCYDSTWSPCFQSGITCPRETGDCTINCNKTSACRLTNMTCPQGHCTMNCIGDYPCFSINVQCLGNTCDLNCHRDFACRNSIVNCNGGDCFLSCEDYEACATMNLQCSGENCLVSCVKDYSCRDSTVEVTRGNFEILCNAYYSCQYSTVLCPSNGQCTINCVGGYRVCQYSRFTCPEGGNCTFIFNGAETTNYVGRNIAITCLENSSCDIQCTGTTNDASNSCRNSQITCPTDSSSCSIQCDGYYACHDAVIFTRGGNLYCSGEKSCQTSTIESDEGNGTIRCSGDYSCRDTIINLPTNTIPNIRCAGRYSCRSSEIICPPNNNCTVSCDGEYSCRYTDVTCPTGDYSCNVLCTNYLSCYNVDLVNTDNAYLHCCGEESCKDRQHIVPLAECPN